MAFPVTSLQPAQCKRLTAGNTGPFFSAAFEKATPQFSPFKPKLSVPLFISKKTPSTPSFLNLFPYCGPAALLLALNYPKSIIRKAKFIIAKRRIKVKISFSRNSNFKFIFSIGVSNKLPVMLPAQKRSIPKHCSKHVGRLL